MMKSFEQWYDKNYRKLLVVPAVLLLVSFIIVGSLYVQTGDIIYKGVSLTGGTSITVSTDISSDEVSTFLSDKLSDFEITTISDNAGNQLELTIIVSEENSESLGPLLEEFFGFELTSENSSVETTSSSLSDEFYVQLLIAIVLAFFLMAAAVFVIFADGRGAKTKVILLNLLFVFFLGNVFLTINRVVSVIIFLAFTVYFIRVYIKDSVPAFAVMLSAFADIVMTLAVVDLLEIKLSTAGIVAFLMLIGYSVDTDILLTSRLMKKQESINKTLVSAFKTGITMTLTSIVAVTAALIALFSFESSLNQIFEILLIGLFFDIVNTWFTNASILKWYFEEPKAFGGKQ